MRVALVALVLPVLLVSACSEERSVDRRKGAPPAHAPKMVAERPVPEPSLEPPEPEPEAMERGDGPCADGDACFAAAAAAEKAGDPAGAAGLYDRGCELGAAQACTRFAELLRDGKGIAPDEERAADIFRFACEQGSQAACDAMGH